MPFAQRRMSDLRVVGCTCYLEIRYWTGGDLPDEVEVGGTWLAASAQRTAINTEAKLLLLTQAFEAWEVRRLAIYTDARNTQSREAIVRLGATFEGVLRNHRASAVASELCGNQRWRPPPTASSTPNGRRCEPVSRSVSSVDQHSTICADVAIVAIKASVRSTIGVAVLGRAHLRHSTRDDNSISVPTASTTVPGMPRFSDIPVTTTVEMLACREASHREPCR